MPSKKKQKTRKAKVCVKVQKRRKCKEIKIKSGIWPEGAFSSVKKLFEAAKKMAKKDGYATVIRRLNLIRIWNKNRNPKLAKRIENVMERLKKMHARGEI
jgi:hypothetical protein